MAEPSQFGPYAEQEVRSQPSLGQTLTGLVSGLVPGYSADEPWYQKVPDLLSLPARAAVQLNPLVQGGAAMDRWMAGDQGPETQQALTGSALGLMTGGFGRPTPGPASFGAWHGSRHLFAPEPGAPLGAFKPIEEVAHTGEGTQAYAYGHYVAGRQGTAETYKTAGIDDFEPQMKLDGKPYYGAAAGSMDEELSGMGALQQFAGDHKAAIKDLRAEAKHLFDSATKPGAYENLLFSPRLSEAEKAQLIEDYKRTDLKDAQHNMTTAKWIEDNHHRVEVTPPDPGHLYQVSVRPDEHELLDWDRPLSEQSPQVQKKFADMGIKEMRDANGNEMSGRGIYHSFGDPRSASQFLHDAGIPGVRFLDANSRGINATPFAAPGTTSPIKGWTVGDQSFATQAEAETAAEAMRTRNYVIFHHSNLKVIGRDGQHYGITPVGHDPWATSQ